MTKLSINTSTPKATKLHAPRLRMPMPQANGQAWIAMVTITVTVGKNEGPGF